MHLPVIVERNAWTLAHERFNADWIEAERMGIVVSSFSRIGEAVGQLLEPQRYREFRANAAARTNTAVYEIPAMLEEILVNHEKEAHRVWAGMDGLLQAVPSAALHQTRHMQGL